MIYAAHANKKKQKMRAAPLVYRVTRMPEIPKEHGLILRKN